MTCEIDLATLFKRSDNVKRMLRPLVNKRAVLVVEIVERVPFITLAVRTGGKVLHHYTAWRFNTYVNGISAAYYERWEPIDATRKRYCFQRGYLHLFQKVGTDQEATEKKLLLLHCDPNEPKERPHARYKQGPHLHVSAAGPPLAEAHIALNYSHLDEVLSSFDNLSVAWDNSIKLVNEEVLALQSEAWRGQFIHDKRHDPI